MTQKLILLLLAVAVFVGTVAAAPPLPIGTVTATVLNVRSGPGLEYRIIAKLREDTTIAVLGRNTAADWLYVCCTPMPGWVSAAWIAPTFPPSTLPLRAPDGTVTSPLPKP